MSDEQSELVHGVSEGGMAAKHPPSDEYAIVVGPKTGAEFNRIRSWLIPVACWRVDDLRFAFDSSFVQPEIKTELAHLAQLVKEHPESPLSIFGHADPTGEDSYNKVLSGRRAKVIYALLISNTAPEDAAQLWEQVGAEEHWGVTENQTMQAVTGLSEGTPRKSLVQAYMQQLCDPELKLEKNKDFLARGADTGGKGDYQGCSEFNPVLIFSQHDQQRFEQAKDKTERNATNAPNRRVMVLLFRKGSKVDPAKWPCPSVKDGIAGCKQRFWSDGEMRRSKRLPDQPRTFPDTQDTFACRFYHRMTTGSPCSQPAPPATVCRFGILGPPDVPGLSKYKYKIDIPADKTPTNITWTVDKPTAGFEEQTDQIEVVVTYQNTKPDWIKLKATFTLDGKNECAEKQIALVKVEVGVATFTNPAKAAGHSTGTKIFLVNPPAPPAAPVWVTKHDPGSDTAAFTYNGTNQPAEPRKFVDSQAGGGGAAYKAVTPVKLISPPEKPTALQKIQVGYIQHGSDAGSATYATTPAGGARTVTIPTTGTVDWLAPSATDEWPWYDQSSRETGSGSGTWSKPDLTLEDSPGLSIPAQYNPNNAGDPNTTKPINTARETFAFIIRIAARTLDSDLEADKHYFDEGNSTWTVNFVWPVVPGISIVTTGAAWTTPGSPSEVSVNVIPTSTNHNSPFLRWTP